MNYTQDQLNEKIAKHKLYLDSDPKGERLDLRGADLRTADLQGAYLQHAYLQGANLRGADLRTADLQGAYLQHAYLQGANLRGADLRTADLQGANLHNADLRGANLRGANMRTANLQGANLHNAYLQGANLQGADLRGANLRGANMRTANLQGANLHNAYLQGANLQGANLQGADLQGAMHLDSHQIVPDEGDFLGWKKVADGVILKLRIPFDAKRTSSLVGRKCRAEKVFVVAAFSSDGKEIEAVETEFRSLKNNTFVYQIRKTVVADSFDSDIRVECTHGIHFFITRKEAEDFTL